MAKTGAIPENWFLFHLGECVQRVHFKGDRHDNDGRGFLCELQHREGGRLTQATGETPGDAIEAAAAKVLHDWGISA